MTQPQLLERPDGHTLAYHYSQATTPSANNLPTVVFCCGFRSTMEGNKALAIERACQRQGLAFIRFDYYGHGQSSGDFLTGTVGRWIDDTSAIIDQVVSGEVLLVGSSMGGWIATCIAKERTEQVKGLVGIASALDFTERLLWARFDTTTRLRLMEEGVIALPSPYEDSPYPITRRLVVEGRRHCLLTKPLHLHCPVRLFHGMEDRTVPWQLSADYLNALTQRDAQLLLIKDGEHRLSRESDIELIYHAIAELIGGPGKAANGAAKANHS